VRFYNSKESIKKCPPTFPSICGGGTRWNGEREAALKLFQTDEWKEARTIRRMGHSNNVIFGEKGVKGSSAVNCGK
jgi:hypothetical protein